MRPAPDVVSKLSDTAPVHESLTVIEQWRTALRGAGWLELRDRRLPLRRGWICEEHRDQPWPHDSGAGPEGVCDDPECPAVESCVPNGGASRAAARRSSS